MIESDMENYFFDTSAFIKYFTSEAGYDLIIDLIDNPNNDTWITELTLTEFYCALYRKYRGNVLTEKNLKIAISAFDKQINRFNVLPMDAFSYQKSRECIKTYGMQFGLRTLDALQIAAFSNIAEKNWTFVAADTIACNVTQLMGFDVINPLEK